MIFNVRCIFIYVGTHIHSIGLRAFNFHHGLTLHPFKQLPLSVTLNGSASQLLDKIILMGQHWVNDSITNDDGANCYLSAGCTKINSNNNINITNAMMIGWLQNHCTKQRGNNWSYTDHHHISTHRNGVKIVRLRNNMDIMSNTAFCEMEPFPFLWHFPHYMQFILLCW